MSKPTKKGRELMNALAPSLGVTVGMLETCSRICRASATYHRLQEQSCNGSYQDWQGNWDEKATERAEKQEKKIEQRITDLCSQLPTIEGRGVLQYSQEIHGEPLSNFAHQTAVVMTGDKLAFVFLNF